MKQKQLSWEENMLLTVWCTVQSGKTVGGWAGTASHISALQISGTMLLYVCRWGLVVISMLSAVGWCERMQSCVQLCTQCAQSSGRRCFRCHAQVFSCWHWHIGRDGVLVSCPDCERHQRAARWQVPQVYWQLCKGEKKLWKRTPTPSHPYVRWPLLTNEMRWFIVRGLKENLIMRHTWKRCQEIFIYCLFCSVLSKDDKWSIFQNYVIYKLLWTVRGIRRAKRVRDTSVILTLLTVLTETQYFVTHPKLATMMR